ncbi:MAG: hypothetical protein ABI579_09515 [Candidatus Sumerlaeota bacterium]
MISSSRLILFSVCALMASHIRADESYVCATEFAGGLVFDAGTKKWHGGAFQPDAKYVISNSQGDDGEARTERVVRNAGEKEISYWCEKDFNETGYLFCRNAFGVFRFNKQNLRFMSTYMVGYVTDGIQNSGGLENKEGDNTPIIRGGVCSPAVAR